MSAWVPLIYDLCVVLIVIYFAAISARRGFVRTVVQFLGYLISMALAGLGAKLFSVTIFEKLLRPTVLRTVEQKLSEAGITQIATDVQTVISKIPDMLRDFLKGYGGGDDMLGEFSKLAGNTQPLPEAVTDHVVGPLVVSVVQLILFFIIFGLCLFLVRKLSWMFQGLRKIPIIGPANTLLGFVVGVLEGLLTIFLLANLINLLIAVTGGGFAYMNEATVGQTVLFRRFLM